mgnify:FL=1
MLSRTLGLPRNENNGDGNNQRIPKQLGTLNQLHKMYIYRNWIQIPPKGLFGRHSYWCYMREKKGLKAVLSY